MFVVTVLCFACSECSYIKNKASADCWWGMRYEVGTTAVNCLFFYWEVSQIQWSLVLSWNPSDWGHNMSWCVVARQLCLGWSWPLLLFQKNAYRINWSVDYCGHPVHAKMQLQDWRPHVHIFVKSPLPLSCHIIEEEEYLGQHHNHTKHTHGLHR